MIKAPAPDDRQARLAEQLRANLRKRKAQAREGADDGDRTPDSDGDHPPAPPDN